ncbi:complement resistance protein TraT [Fusobacterium varium]|uniref:complement resistance protein TraT n=1 Tax=Fusobacterium TaxID=848 RepID=UPI00102FA1EE|nr:complement resistance protein TraT [Fusobacterium ulcerans]
MKKYFLLTMVLIILLLSGCSSLETAIKKRNLATETKLSETIWLNPENITDKTVFIQVKNTSTSNLDIESEIKNTLIGKGYKIVSAPKNANYWLQVNILQLSKMDLKESQAALSGVAGAGIGAAIGGYNTGSVNTAIGWGLVGGAIGILSDALVEDAYYTMITDILISEKSGTKVNNLSINATTQGTQGRNIYATEGTGNMNKYQTRVVSTANKVNLELPDAEPQLKNELIKTISNIF